MTGLWMLTAVVCATEAIWLKQWRPVRVPSDLAPAEQLNEGVSWDDAWPDDGDLAVVRDAFASSWHSGASPVERLETAVEQLDWDERSRIEQAAAKLSVRLLLPTGLCFLPAFVAVGIIPSFMSFVQ